jgi:signal transduction histidine kinase
MQTLHAQQNNFIPVYKILSDTATEQQLQGSNYQILEDKKGGWDIEEVSKLPLSGKFHFDNKGQGETNVKGIYWIRYRLKNTMDHPANIVLETNSEYNDFYLFHKNSNPVHLVTGFMVPWEKRDGFKANTTLPIQLGVGEELAVYQRSKQIIYPVPLSVKISSKEKNNRDYVDAVESRTNYFSSLHLQEMFLEGLLFLMIFYNLSFFGITKEREYLYFSLFILFLAIARLFNTTSLYTYWYHPDKIEYVLYLNLSFGCISFFLVQFIRTFFKTYLFYKVWDKFLLILSFASALVQIIVLLINPSGVATDSAPVSSLAFSFTCLAVLITFLIFLRKNNRYSKLVITGGLPLMLLWVVAFPFYKTLALIINLSWFRFAEVVCITWFALCFSLILFKKFNYLRKENAQQALDNERLAKEKEMERSRLIEQQKTELEKQVTERTAELKRSLEELKSTQSQLIQSEKMASLGELTAGIAHEIQNPLNFVNNFSEVSSELIDELQGERSKVRSERNEELEDEIINDIKQNLEKINHHGRRAENIVRGMMQHSRTNTGQKEPTDVNALCDEYLRLSYHGLRAKDKDFNADFKTDFDNNIGKVNVVPQDMGRVLLNLFNNAFYAVNEKKQKLNGIFYPSVNITTRKQNGIIILKVQDNGNGIPQNIVDKIFQPFFTTKPPGQGTGLGLSLSYDIVKTHGGEIKVETKENEETTFIIQLPYNTPPLGDGGST